MIYFTSNEFFFPTKTNQYAEEYNNFIIDNWNKDVAAGDTVYVLGGLFRKTHDNSFNKVYVEEIVNKLNGTIHYIPNDTTDTFELCIFLDSISVEYQFATDIIYNNATFILTPTPIDAIEHAYKYCDETFLVVNCIGDCLSYVEDMTQDSTYVYCGWDAKHRLISAAEIWVELVQDDYVAQLMDEEMGYDDFFEEDDWDDE